jgi:hypothetical protein
MTPTKLKYLFKFYKRSASATLLVMFIVIAGITLLISDQAFASFTAVNPATEAIASSATYQYDINTENEQTSTNSSSFYNGKLLSVQATTSELSALETLNANSVRSEFQLNSDGTAFNNYVEYDGTSTSQWLDQMTSGHIEPVPLLNTYVNITPGSNIYINPTIWANAVVNWCKQYCSGGTFYQNNPSANSYYGPHILEMLNEPYGTWFRNGAVPAQGYADMLIATRTALDKAGMSDISILGAAGNAGDSTNYWTTAVAADGGYAAVQGLAVHPYSTGNITLPGQDIAEDGWNTIYYYHQLYNMDIYVTEVGWCSESTIDNSPCQGRNQPEADKDADITDAINQLATVPWIKDFDYFDMADQSACTVQNSGPCINENFSYGLYLSNGSATPAFYAYEAAAKTNGF